MLLFRQRAVVFSPPPERPQVAKTAKHHCRFCGAEGHNVATCAAAPCNRCGLSGHIGKNCPDKAKAKKAKNATVAKTKVEG